MGNIEYCDVTEDEFSYSILIIQINSVPSMETNRLFISVQDIFYLVPLHVEYLFALLLYAGRL